MKFKKLVGKFENLVDEFDHGHKVKAHELVKLQQLLEAKKTRYEIRLGTTEDADKRRKLETRLKVVDAQLEKVNQLLASV